VSGHIKWPELAAAGMGLLGLAMTGWYTAAKYGDRVRRKANSRLALDESPGMSLLSGPGLSALSLAPDDNSETGPEEILAARMERSSEPFLDAVAGWLTQLWVRLPRLGWLRIPVLALALLPLLALYSLLYVLLLPLIIAGYLFDLDQDFRLRVIVAAFAVGTAFEIVATLSG
jgi:hypothetical protein